MFTSIEAEINFIYENSGQHKNHGVHKNITEK